MIIGDGTGTTLLDTIAGINTPVIADLHTGKTTLSMTSIYYAASYKVFRVNTYTTAKPGSLQYVLGGDSFPTTKVTVPTPVVGGDVFFKNVPPQPYGMTIQSYSGGPGTYQPDPYGIRYSYYQGMDNAVCIFFPYIGKYKYHIPASPHDTVDLSTMDESVKVKFNVAQYRFDYLNETANGEVIYTDHWCDTVPVSPLLIDDTYYTVSSSQNNNFSINFLKGDPGLYYTDWKGTSFTWQLTVPSDSVLLHPLSDISALNSKLLKGQNLGSMTAVDLSFGYQYSQGKFSPPGIYSVKQPPTTYIIKNFP